MLFSTKKLAFVVCPPTFIVNASFERTENMFSSETSSPAHKIKS